MATAERSGTADLARGTSRRALRRGCVPLEAVSEGVPRRHHRVRRRRGTSPGLPEEQARALQAIVLSPRAKGGGYANTIHYTHSSTLRTIEEIFGLTPMLGDAVNATDLSDLFVSFP